MSEEEREDGRQEEPWEQVLNEITGQQDHSLKEEEPFHPLSAVERFGSSAASSRKETGDARPAETPSEDFRREDGNSEFSELEEDELGKTRVITGVDDGKKRRRSRKRKGNKPEKKKRNEALGCLKSILYVTLVIAVSCSIAYVAYVAFVDFTGIGRDTMKIDVVVPEGSSTQQVADILKEQNVIEQPMLFRVYCRLLHKDGTFHSGTHTVAANMGYSELAEKLSEMEVRETVTVTVPEGSTIDAIANLLEENNVCSASDFYTAVVAGDYEDYDFIAEITPEERKDRVYLLEGYLFPDTYQFYQECSPETAVRVFLDGFAQRVTPETRAAIRESGQTLSEVVIEASLVQREARFAEDMPRVGRVLLNRLASPEFPKLQFDSTGDYLQNLVPSGTGGNVLDTAYDTYVREGLPVGAICNPGLAAINAVLNPSEEPEIINCYYFASIIETGETEFFETFEEHEAWCRAHGVGIYA